MKMQSKLKTVLVGETSQEDDKYVVRYEWTDYNEKKHNGTDTYKTEEELLKEWEYIDESN